MADLDEIALVAARKVMDVVKGRSLLGRSVQMQAIVQGLVLDALKSATARAQGGDAVDESTVTRVCMALFGNTAPIRMQSVRKALRSIPALSTPQPDAVPDGRAVAAARDAWFESDEGRMLQSTITGAPSGKYLRNRLEVAFIAGYTARSSAQGAAGAGDGWRSMDDWTPPHNARVGVHGTEYLVWPIPGNGERCAFYGRRLGGKACWYRYDTEVHGVTHWMPLPHPPQDERGEVGR